MDDDTPRSQCTIARLKSVIERERPKGNFTAERLLIIRGGNTRNDILYGNIHVRAERLL